MEEAVMRRWEKQFVGRQVWKDRENQQDETKFREKEDVITKPKTEGKIREKEETWKQIREKHSKSPVQQ